MSHKQPKPDFDLKYPEQITKDYIIGPILGSGTSSIVRKITEKSTREEFAVKIIDRKLLTEKQQKTEIGILKKVKHQNIISIHDVIESSTHIFIIMELVTGGELFDELVKRGSFSESDAAQIIFSITTGVEYLHEKGIVHRDLKPENLLFATPDAKVVKIADFGLASIVGTDAALRTPCGTPVCVAPEVLLCEGYGKEVDMWTVGVIMYILLCGYPPFQEGLQDNNLVKLFEQIIRAEYKFHDKHWKDISAEAKDLIKHLLVRNPRERYTAKQVLAHKWIAENKFTKQVDVFEQMIAFNSMRKLKALVFSLVNENQYQIIKYQNPTEEQLTQLKNAFEKADIQHHGQISIKTLKELLDFLGLDVHDERVRQLSAKYPENSEIIDFEHFCYLAQTLFSKPPDDLLKKAFQMLDRNQDGQISYSDFHAILTSKLPKEQEEHVLKVLDKSKKLDFEGFYKLVQDKSERNLLNDSKLLEPRHHPSTHNEAKK